MHGSRPNHSTMISLSYQTTYLRSLLEPKDQPFLVSEIMQVVANPVAGAGGATDSDKSGHFAPPHVVPVCDTRNNGTGSSNLDTSKPLTVAEAPPVTELGLVTESPLENGLSTSHIGVIGGNKIHFLLGWSSSFGPPSDRSSSIRGPILFPFYA